MKVSAYLRGGPDTLFDPLRAVLVRLIDELQRLDVCARMGSDQKPHYTQR